MARNLPSSITDVFPSYKPMNDVEMTQVDMTEIAPLPLDVGELRQKYYDATITRFDRVHDDLAILGVRPDDGPLSFDAGQYSVLGLGYWEPRTPDTQEEALTADNRKLLVRRAYSISSPLLDDAGNVVRATQCEELEFYVALVRHADHPPALTPRLFMLGRGDRIHLGRNCHGHYTLDRIQTDDTLVFMATGTGEAPHNAMLAELLADGHRGPIVSAVCVRHQRDLAYLGRHRLLERMYDNYRYLTLTTREPENIDPQHPRYVGKRYLQDYFDAEDLEADAGIEMLPETTRVFLCGSPAMIGVPLHTHDRAKRYPDHTGMVELLENRGFRIDRPHEPGNLHFEKYW